MATVEDLLAAIKHVNDCAGDPQAWQTGLTPQEVSDVATIYGASPQKLDTLLTRIRGQHPDFFNPATGAMVFPPADQPPSNRQEGDAADAIRSAESALAQQHTIASQLDLQVVGAILNAHLTTVDGKEALDRLQHEIESAVRTRIDLDTAAGARDFQRFLVGKVDEIRTLVANASLDNTSKAALLAALTALYNVAQTDHPDPAERSSPPTAGTAASSEDDSAEPADTDIEPDLDSPLNDDVDFSPADAPAQVPTPVSSPAVPSLPASAGIAPLGGAAMPSGPMPSWAAPGGFPIPDPFEGLGKRGSPDDELDDAAFASVDPTSDESDVDGGDGGSDDDSAEPPDESTGPTKVTLPNGETVTAASPELAAAIEAAVDGTPIADAFRQQGITIPPPGTAVTEPIDPPQTSPGDIGMFTDRHALALGRSEALVNGQIQHISTVQGPSFLGWEHPPASVDNAAPAKTEPPTPTRPAAVAGA